MLNNQYNLCCIFYFEKTWILLMDFLTLLYNSYELYAPVLSTEPKGGPNG